MVIAGNNIRDFQPLGLSSCTCIRKRCKISLVMIRWNISRK